MSTPYRILYMESLEKRALKCLTEGLIKNCSLCLEKLSSSELEWDQLKDNFKAKTLRLQDVYETQGDQFLSEIFCFISNDLLSEPMTDEKIISLKLIFEKLREKRDVNFEDYYELQNIGEAKIDMDSFFSGGELLHFKA